jgi:thiol-disulfide isomerase/thioredoxin
MTIPENPTILEVWAPWCAECKAMQPSVDSIAAEYPEVDLVMVNAAERRDDAAGLGVRGTPTLIGYSGGRELFRETGRRTSVELQLLFESVASGSVSPAVSRVDVALRFGAGAVLAALGLASGPSWILVVAGVSAGLFGYLAMRRRAA